MELVLLIAALILFIIAAATAWRGPQHPWALVLIAAGLACWVGSTLVGAV